MDIQENIKEFSDSEIERLKRERQSSSDSSEGSAATVDIYQRDKDRLRDVSRKSYPNGSSRAVNMALYAVIDGTGSEGLAKAYNRAKDDIEALNSQGERGRAEVRRNQYMTEDFMPAVEIVVNSTSPDEVLNSKQALNELDKYALVVPGGSGKGYTATYIRQAYGNQLGQQEGRSDPSVRSDVMRINAMLDGGQIRTAVSIANNVKDKIDRGDAMADDIDYDFVGRVVSFYK